MKRSELEKKLYTAIGKYLTDHYNGSCDTPLTKAVKRVLKVIDKSGMQPPEYKCKDGVLGSCLKSAWEPEDV